MTNYFAHSANDEGERHPLKDHLTAVARMARDFAETWGAGEVAFYAGLWHDIGKFHRSFQEYLSACEREPDVPKRGPDHKGAGALLAEQHAGLAALLIQGHHGGLRSAEDLRGWLSGRAAEVDVQEALALAKRELPDIAPGSRLTLPRGIESMPRSAEVFFRLVFSALVDADYLDTEAHFHRRTSRARASSASLGGLLEVLQRHIDEIQRRCSDEVGAVRRAVYGACMVAAEQDPGVFRLAAPTGAGKTLSSMAFALKHAATHGQARVIVAVPFISITEQTADVYRGVFEGPGQTGIVLEHHSEAYADTHGEDFRPGAVWSRLASENWDAPIVVTTTVQLLESLFANQTSRCRKLHRIANSVVIIDEAQSLPPHLLRPILDILRELTARYNTTVVVSTATQPAFETIKEFKDVSAIDILPNAKDHFAALRRVEYEWLMNEPATWAAAADRLRSQPQGLAVVNTKKDALALLDALGDPEALHLSTLLCGAHRRAVIREVKRRLAAGLPCRLVTTQVVEAGVDIDFPFVMRALAPLDSVIQAAGRCNREGRLAAGHVLVFRPAEGALPPGPYKTGAGITASLLNRGDVDPHDPASAKEYFRMFFDSVETDREEIQPLRESLDYPEVAHRFRMIPDDTESVVITSYGTNAERAAVRQMIERLRAGAPEARLIHRRLQPYIVSVRRREAERYARDGFISPITSGLGEWLGEYHDVRGLASRDQDPDKLVI